MKVEANGIEMGYDLLGPEGAPVVVLSHSLAASRRMWEPQLSALTENYRVLRYDIRGHGESGLGEADISLELLVADAAALLAALEFPRVHFVGLSLGGVIAQGLALARPEALLSLALCDTLARAPEGFGAMWGGRVEVARAEGMAGLVELTVGRWFTAPFVAEAPEMAWVRAMVAATPPEGYAGCTRALIELDLLDRLGEVRLPTLVVVGADDPGTPVAMAEVIAEAIPGARLEVLADAAHLPNIE
jgi:3-oxoadipate enol-lactonase